MPGSGCASSVSHRVVILSAVRAASEGIAEGLQRFLRLDILTQGALGDEMDAAWAAQNSLTLVYDGSIPCELWRLRDLGRVLRSPRIVVFGLGDIDDDVRSCARHQVVGLVARDAPMSELAEAIEVVSEGKHYTSVSLIPRLMQLAAMTQHLDTDNLSLLTDRERQVATRLGRGLTYAQIAFDLNVSPATVKNHVHNIYCKLRQGGTRDRADESRDAPRPREVFHGFADRLRAPGNEENGLHSPRL